MAEVKWVKLNINMFDNRKIKHLRRLPEGNNIVLIWVMLLTMAGRCNAGGMIFLTENIPYTAKMLADELDFEENTVVLALQALEQLDMIVTDNDFFAIAGWEKYQNIEGLDKIREQTRKRVAKCRENKRLEAGGVTCNVTVTDCNAIEEEGEKDKEKEIHSFVLSRESEEEISPEEKASAQRRYLHGIGEGVVFLSDDQISSLLDELTVEEFDHYVKVIAECEKAGKRFKKKTHYDAILEMARKDRKV